MYRYIFLVISLIPSIAFSAGYTLSWDASRTAGVTGYRLYYGANNEGGPYSESVDVGNVLAYAVNIPDFSLSTKYCFVATAHNADTDNVDTESVYSNEVCVKNGVQMFRIITTVGSGGTVTPMNPLAAPAESLAFSVTADPGRVASISGCGGSPNSGTGTFTYTATATAGCSITATFAPSGTPPTDPSSLRAGAVGTSKTNLAWSASVSSVGLNGYRVERCTGSVCANFSQVLSTTSTSITDKNLSASTIYRYRVRALDVNGVYSGYSNVAEAVTNSVGLPASNFSCTPVTGTAYVRPTCTDTSPGNPTSWYWSCGNGTYSSSQTPQCYYPSEGRYTICLTTNTSSQYCKAGYILVRPRGSRNVGSVQQ